MLAGEAAGGGVAARWARNFVPFAKLTARGNHPVCEVEHGPLEDAWAINSRFSRPVCEPNLFPFLEKVLTVIFSHIFVMPVVHGYSFGEKRVLLIT
jgi:hypothetical protein